MKSIKKLVSLVFAALSCTALAFAVGCKDTPESSSPAPQPAPHVHAWDDGVATTAATNAADGVMVYTCACGETKTDIAHYWLWTKRTDPTCDADGAKDGVCLHCNTTATAAIAKRGHDYGNDGICVRCEDGKASPLFPEAAEVQYIDILDENSDIRGSGGDYDRYQLEEGYYTLDVAKDSKVWLAFSVRGVGQYALYSTTPITGVSVNRYDASDYYINPQAFPARVLNDGNFYSTVNVGEKYYNNQWRATFCVTATADVTLKFRFVRIADPAWEAKNIYEPVIPVEINGKKASEPAAGESKTEVPYTSSYFFDQSTGYYRLGTPTDPGKVIYAAITSTPERLLSEHAFHTIQAESGTFVLALYVGVNADGDYLLKNYIPFIMNCKDDYDITTEKDPTKNCYENYVNADGLYPVTKELQAFLDLYTRKNRPFNIPDEIWETKRENAWLSACYYYDNLTPGTETYPMEFTEGNNAVTIAKRDFFYGTFKGNGVYTISSNDTNLRVKIGDKNYVGPFSITFEASSLGQSFMFSAVNAAAHESSVTITAAQGVSVEAPTAIATPLSFELSTYTVLGANGELSYKGYYSYTAKADGTLILTLAESTNATVILDEQTLSGTTASMQVTNGQTVVIYIGANAETSVSASVVVQ